MRGKEIHVRNFIQIGDREEVEFDSLSFGRTEGSFKNIE